MPGSGDAKTNGLALAAGPLPHPPHHAASLEVDHLVRESSLFFPPGGKDATEAAGTKAEMGSGIPACSGEAEILPWDP